MQAQSLMSPEGDFALGMRGTADGVGTSFTHSDFATGVRVQGPGLTVGTFATGQVTEPSFVKGRVATGQSSRSLHVRIPYPSMHDHEHGQPTVGGPAMEAGRS
jgi:hypothetical protein